MAYVQQQQKCFGRYLLQLFVAGTLLIQNVAVATPSFVIVRFPPRRSKEAGATDVE